MPLARTKRDDPTFTKADAYALVGRLAASWGYLTNEPGREDILAQEYLAQFDGYDPAKVHQAVTNAIGKAKGEPPSAGEIKAELKALIQPLRPSERSGYRPPYRGPSPEYREWHKRDRELTIEAAAKAKASGDDDSFGKLSRKVADGLEG